MPRSGSRLRVVSTLAVGVVTLGAFAPSLWNGFVDFDDQANLVDNLRFRGLGAAELRWMATAFHLGHWHPLTWLTFAFDYELWGMTPAGYHLTSVLWHATNAMLVAVLARRLMARAGVVGGELAAALGALLWSVHPLRVESVAWATERRDVVSGCFLLLALLAWERRPAGPLALVCGALAVLGKASAMVLPALLLVLDVWPLGRLGGAAGWTRGRVWVEKLPFVALTLVAGVVALLAQRAAGALQSLAVVPAGARVGAAMYQAGFYLWKTVVPVSLLPIYEYPLGMGPAHPLALAGAATAAGLVAGAWALRRRAPAFPAAVAAYVIALGPTLGAAQSGPQVAADRYTYLPTIGLSLVAGAALAGSGARLPRLALGGALVAGLAGLTAVQTATWRDARTLWTRAVAIAPDNAFAQYRMGDVERLAGNTDGALRRLREAVRLRPVFAEAQNDLAAVLAANGQLDEALGHYRQAMQANPRFALAYTSLGAALAEAGRTDEALAMDRQALAVDPGLMEAHANLGALLDQLGRSDEAMREYEEALRIRPSAEVLNDVAIVLAARGEHAGAAARYREALALRPEVAAIHVNLAYALTALGDRAGARAELEAALRIEPGSATALAALEAMGPR